MAFFCFSNGNGNGNTTVVSSEEFRALKLEIAEYSRNVKRVVSPSERRCSNHAKPRMQLPSLTSRRQHLFVRIDSLLSHSSLCPTVLERHLHYATTGASVEPCSSNSLNPTRIGVLPSWTDANELQPRRSRTAKRQPPHTVHCGAR